MSRFPHLLGVGLAVFAVGTVFAAGVAAEAVAGKDVCRVQPFALSQVRLLDGPFKEAMLRDKQYLFDLDADRLLHTFRLTAGLPSSAEPYGGWEKPECEVRGHSMGHFLSACALMYASTGDVRLKAKADAIVAELAKCQQALPSRGCHPGYLSAFPESFIDRVEARQEVWAPWYTQHKIMAGLLDVHTSCGNRQALDVLVRMADWVKFRVDRLTVEQMQASLASEFGGMNEVLANLYAITANPDHLRMARAFDQRSLFDPLAAGEDRLDGLHANTQIPKIIGAAREYEVTGEERYRNIASVFWRTVARNRSYCIGGHSDGEYFFPVGQFSQHLGPATAETCNTYNMLKLSRRLFAWDPSAEVMDFYERGLYNHILASQDPEKGMVTYFASLKPGHIKSYATPEDSFWCCMGTGMENHAKYGDTIYFHDADSLYVNLFIASELTWKEKGLVVRQETQFPEEAATRLTLHCQQPLSLALRIRYPSWAQAGMRVRINGKEEPIQGVPGSYIAIRRQWRDGDQIRVELPMALHLEPLPNTAAPSIVAVLYGPIVLAGELGRQGLENVSPYARVQLDLAGVPTPDVPVWVGDTRELLQHISPVAGKPLTFQTRRVGHPTDVTLIPFYRLHHQRYSVYWKVFGEYEWKQKQAELAAATAKRKAFEARRVDEVAPGEQQPETDHGFQGAATNTGEFRNRKWRDANNGWFSYQMKVLPDRPTVLLCTYWGSDNGPRQFDILVDGRKVATQTLDNNRPGEFFDVEYPLPAELTQGKPKVTVRFQAQPGKVAGGLFGCMLLKAEK